MEKSQEVNFESFLPPPCTSENSEEVRSYYEEAIIDTARECNQKEHLLRKEFGRKLDLIEQRYTELKDQFDDILLSEKTELKEKLKTEYEQQLTILRDENESLEDDVRALRKKLHSALQSASLTVNEGGAAKSKSNSEISQCTKHIEQIAKLRSEVTAKERTAHDAQKQTTDVISKMGHLRRQLEDSKKELSIRERLIVELEHKLEQAICKAQQNASANGDCSGQSESTDMQIDTDQASRKRRLQPMDSAEEIVEWKARLDSEVDKRMSRDQQTRIAATNSAFDALRIKKLEQTVAELTEELQQPTKDAKTLADVQEEARTKQMLLEQKLASIEERNEELESRVRCKDDQLDSLQARVKQLVTELDEKVEGIRVYSEKTEQYIRQREAQQSDSYEKVISAMKNEHEKDLERLKIQLQEVDFRESLQAAASANLQRSSTGHMSKSAAFAEQSLVMSTSSSRRPMAYSYQAGSLDRSPKKSTNQLECRLPDKSNECRVREWVFNCDPSLEEVDLALMQQGMDDPTARKSALDELAHILSSKDELNRKMKGDLYDRGRNRSTSKLADKWNSFVCSMAETTRRASSLTRKPPSGRPRKRNETNS